MNDIEFMVVLVSIITLLMSLWSFQMPLIGIIGFFLGMLVILPNLGAVGLAIESFGGAVLFLNPILTLLGYIKHK